MTVTVRLPEGSTKDDIQIQFLPDNINIKLKDIQVVEGKLYSSIDHEGSTWTIKENDGYFYSLLLKFYFLRLHVFLFISLQVGTLKMNIVVPSILMISQIKRLNYIKIQL